MCRMKQAEQLPLPNPGDWCDTDEAARLLQRARPTLYDIVQRGALHRYKIGTVSVFWRAEVLELAAALRRSRGRAVDG